MKSWGLLLLVLFVGSQTVSARPKDIDFINHRTSSETLDLGQTGPTMGDIHINKGEMLDPKTKSKIGTYITRQIIVGTDVGGGTYTADMSQQFRFKDGTVSVIAIDDFSMDTNRPASEMVMAIVGGTDKYDGARGVQVVVPVQNPENDKHIYFKFK